MTQPHGLPHHDHMPLDMPALPSGAEVDPGLRQKAEGAWAFAQAQLDGYWRTGLRPPPEMHVRACTILRDAAERDACSETIAGLCAVWAEGLERQAASPTGPELADVIRSLMRPLMRHGTAKETVSGALATVAAK